MKKESKKKEAPKTPVKGRIKKSAKTDSKASPKKSPVKEKKELDVPLKKNNKKIASKTTTPISKKEIVKKTISNKESSGKKGKAVNVKNLKKSEELIEKIEKKVSKVREPAGTTKKSIKDNKIVKEKKTKVSENKIEDSADSNADIISPPVEDLSEDFLAVDDSKESNQKNINKIPANVLGNINYTNFKKADKPEPIKIEVEPTVLVKTEVKKAEAGKAEIKTKLFEKCLEIQTNSVNIAKKAMNDAQESANEEKGSMEEKFDSFRESMHIARDMYARQLQEGVNSLSILKRINPTLEHNTVILGSVVYTELQNYFISVSLGEVQVDNDKFITISTLTPLFQALSGKKKGDKFKFRDTVYTILDVF